MTGSRKKRMILYSVLFAVSAVFYLFWYWHDGIVITPDAQSYIDMASDREPIYPLFLWLCRGLAGQTGYQDLAVILQCILAAVAAVVITMKLQERFSLGLIGTGGILLIQYGITFLNRFVAQRKYSYYNSIETEAITYSLWILFILSLLEMVYDKSKKSILWSIILAVILMATRKQMLIAFGLLFLCILTTWYKDKGWKKAFTGAILLVIIGLASTRLIDCAYNYVSRGEFAPHTGDSSFILGTELYVANPDMAQYIQDDDRRAVFNEIMERADENEYNAQYAGSGWQNIEDHYSASYDRIKFDIVMIVIREYQDKHNVPQEYRDSNYNEIADAMMKELLMPCIPGIIRIFGSNVVHGMVTTVLKVHRILNWIAVILYIAYVSVFIRLIQIRGLKNCSNSSVPFALLVILAIVFNVVLTSATIYPQMRYMLYNTALFYQAGLIMLLELFHEEKKRRNG